VNSGFLDDKRMIWIINPDDHKQGLNHSLSVYITNPRLLLESIYSPSFLHPILLPPAAKPPPSCAIHVARSINLLHWSIHSLSLDSFVRHHISIRLVPRRDRSRLRASILPNNLAPQVSITRTASILFAFTVDP
jgi:hypothetical protein